ncbi:MAG: hypothetical protein QM811_02105 [Pirellulales bacterium]
MAERPQVILPSSLFAAPANVADKQVAACTTVESVRETTLAPATDAIAPTPPEQHAEEITLGATPLDAAELVDVLPLPEMRRAAVDRAAFPALIEKLAGALRYGRTRVIHWHVVGDGATGRAHLDALAEAWGASRTERLLFIDAQLDPTTVSTQAGWWDVVADRATLAESLHETEYASLARMFVGRRPRRIDDEARLRLAGGLLALQRDHRAIWLVTSGEWTDAAQAIAHAAHERYLVVPTPESAAWRRVATDLTERNVLVNGWIAVAPRSAPDTMRLSA